MELKQLEAYVKVYELCSFSMAAEEMFLSQPSVSAYIHSLEKEFRLRLIHRSSKEFVPTKAGRLFYEYAKEMLTLKDKSINALKSLSDCKTGSIDILASSVPAQYILPKMLGDFHKVNPGIKFNVKQSDTAGVIDGISEYKGEIGFVGAKIENAKCVYEEFLEESLVLIAPPEKRFEGVNPEEIGNLLRGEHFVMREPGSGTRLEYEEYIKNIGLSTAELNVSAYFNNTQSIIHAVANGLGISIVSGLAAGHYIGKKTVIPVYCASFPKRRFYIVLKRKCVISAAAESLIEFARTYAEKHNAL